MAEEELIHLYEVQIENSLVTFYQLSFDPPNVYWMRLSDQTTKFPESNSLTRLIARGYRAQVNLLAKFDRPKEARLAKAIYLRQPEQNLDDDLRDDSRTPGPIRCLVCHLSTPDHSQASEEVICNPCKKLHYRFCSRCSRVRFPHSTCTICGDQNGASPRSR